MIVKELKGFTMIELLVVVLIIGILAAIALPQYQTAMEKARATEAIMLGKNIADAANTYKLVTGQWPSSYDTLDIAIPGAYTTAGELAKSNNFEIQLDGATGAIRIFRLNSSAQRTDYYFWWDLTAGRRTCNIHATIINRYNEKGKKLCESLGGIPAGINGIWNF